MRIWTQPNMNLNGKILHYCYITSYRLFLEKSKNEWSKRHKFVKQPNALDLVEMDYDERASVGKVNLNPNSSKSNLAMPIKEIISLFFDTKLMNSALVEFDLDVEKMPLGKLSHKHILSAHSVLSDIEKVSRVLMLTLLVCLVDFVHF